MLARFIKCITKLEGTTLDDDEYLDLAMPMYNLIKYSWTYSNTTGSSWLYSKDESITFDTNIVD